MPTLKVRLRPWWHTYEETRDGSAPGLWALARFLQRKQLPGEKEKNVLAGCQPRPVVPKAYRPNAFRPLAKAFFSFSPALETHGAQKRAKAHSPGLLQDHARVSFIVSGFLACGPRREVPNPKFQITNKNQSSKNQFPNQRGAGPIASGRLVIGAWSLVLVWNLVLGISPRRA